MNLSKRLKVIADLVDTKRIIDVGCDHGYLDIYLTLYKNCSCVATDISENAIKNCLNNIKKYHLDNKIEVLVNDGIDGIHINNSDTLILSGMGTMTIINILSNKELPDNIIISSNNNLEMLRRFMVGLGFMITNEVFVLEHDIHYVIIKFSKGYKEYNNYEYILGPIIINNSKYKKYILAQYKKLLLKIPKKENKIRDYYIDLINFIEK